MTAWTAFKSLLRQCGDGFRSLKDSPRCDQLLFLLGQSSGRYHKQHLRTDNGTVFIERGYQSSRDSTDC